MPDYVKKSVSLVQCCSSVFWVGGITKLLSFSRSLLLPGFHNGSSVTLPSALCCSSFSSPYGSEFLPPVLHISLLG